MKEKTKFYCTECGNETAKWFGQCPACGRWNTVVEAPADTPNKSKAGAVKAAGAAGLNRPKRIREVDTQEEIRFSTGMGELDRVLGGGAVVGSMVLVGGAPGIGKSTLLLQICGFMGGEHTILYVSGEESERQIKLRADRLGVTGGGLLLASGNNCESIIQAVRKNKPDIVIIDSIQTITSSGITSSAGSVVQVRECTNAFMHLAKSEEIPIFIVSHVNKDGGIAGPKIMEHIVDTVLYFEGEKQLSYRILRAIKNRFGSTNEIGVFNMDDDGLHEVTNPSEMMLSGRITTVSGSAVVCTIEGTRPILAEVQALVTKSTLSAPRRVATGFDYNRLYMILAVLEKRTGFFFGGVDVYVNIVGGLRLDEPAADLAIAIAVASAALDKPAPDTLAAIGEVGLTGELRNVNNLSQRLSEVRRLGFTECIIPKQHGNRLGRPDGLKLTEVQNVGEALRVLARS